MPPRVEIIPIRPSKNPFPQAGGIQAKLLAVMRDLGRDGQNKISAYPPAQTSYRRTGDLGRKWDVEGPKFEGAGDLIVRVGTNNEYAIFVQGPTKGSGPKQRDLFKNLGWSNVTDVGQEVWDQRAPLIIKILQDG